MKNLRILFLLIPFISISQNKLHKITYLSIANIDIQVRSLDILYVNEKMAYYEIGKKELIHKEEPRKDNELPNMYRTQKERTTSFVYTDIINSKLYNTLEKQQIYKTVEPIPVMNWVLKDETKEIEGVLLQKATVNFRGRDYEAWCQLNVPITTGPWKFNNAPGLIYEIKSLEEDYSYYWSLKEFKEITEDKK